MSASILADTGLAREMVRSLIGHQRRKGERAKAALPPNQWTKVTVTALVRMWPDGDTMVVDSVQMTAEPAAAPKERT